MLLPSVFTNDFTNDDFFDDFFNAPARRSYMPSASMKCDVKELDQSYQIDIWKQGQWLTVYMSDQPMRDCKVIRFPQYYQTSRSG